MILQCPRCRKTRIWNKESQPSGPGECCAREPYKVLKEEPKYIPGHVIQIRGDKYQELYGPKFYTYGNRWKPISEWKPKT
jgi:hypothetical protein